MQGLCIAGRNFSSRLLLGTGKFASHEVMREALSASGAQVVTVALRRVDLTKPDTDILNFIDREKFLLLPNTSGAQNAKEAVMLARLSREAGLGDWVKLEVVPEPRYLLPDPIETLSAAETLVKEGFVVLPYINADPILALRLTDAGCATVMPLGSPIDSNRGIKTREPAHLRDKLLPLGITQMSAGSVTSPGGYTRADQTGEQFHLEDTRTPTVAAMMLTKAGYDPVWKDWGDARP